MVNRYSAYRRGSDAIPPELIDRILLGACAAIWLVLLGVSVAATVALSDLSRGFHKSASSPHTTWVLYAVIIVSALIIAGAVPVLLRARRMTQPETAAQPSGTRGAGDRQAVVAARLAHTAHRGRTGPRARACKSRSRTGVVWCRGGPGLVARHRHPGRHDGCRADRGRGGDLLDGRRARRALVGGLRRSPGSSPSGCRPWSGSTSGSYASCSAKH